ncbi:hypothetical protein [Halorarius halobius]|uniref:DUF7855 family protein n=1 Tax=Halorarius halobius TaxID=2962671 RepID=UPI0020CDD0C7|nr:hypothetical protein [Halorarius halobius]
MLLVVTYSRESRTALRNVCRSHEESVVRRFGRAALLEETGKGAFLACRLRERHPVDVQVERTRPLNEYADVPDDVREAAVAYEREAGTYTPYAKFAAGTDHPEPDALRDREL